MLVVGANYVVSLWKARGPESVLGVSVSVSSDSLQCSFWCFTLLPTWPILPSLASLFYSQHHSLHSTRLGRVDGMRGHVTLLLPAPCLLPDCSVSLDR